MDKNRIARDSMKLLEILKNHVIRHFSRKTDSPSNRMNICRILYQCSAVCRHNQDALLIAEVMKQLHY